MTDIEQLSKDRDTWRQAAWDWDKKHADARDALYQERKANIGLRAALETYGRHSMACGRDSLDPICTCGWDETSRKCLSQPQGMKHEDR